MKQIRKYTIYLALIISITLFFTLSILNPHADTGLDEPQTETEKLFDGVTYIKATYKSPRRMVVHVVKINIAKAGIKAFVTPPDNPKSDKPYNAQTTSDFVKEYGVQLAINGSGFHPWYDYGLIYTPHPGTAVSPLGTTITDDFKYSDEGDESRPLLLFGGNRPVDIGYIDRKADYAVSGIRMLVDDGAVLDDLDNRKTNPHTAVGNSQDGHTLIIVVVDGRQLFYSRGSTTQELAQLLLDYGAYRALELDGGGSSTLVVNKNDTIQVLNSPIHRHIPGNERPVANHVGFYIK